MATQNKQSLFRFDVLMLTMLIAIFVLLKVIVVITMLKKEMVFLIQLNIRLK